MLSPDGKAPVIVTSLVLQVLESVTVPILVASFAANFPINSDPGANVVYNAPESFTWSGANWWSPPAKSPNVSFLTTKAATPVSVAPCADWIALPRCVASVPGVILRTSVWRWPAESIAKAPTSPSSKVRPLELYLPAIVTTLSGALALSFAIALAKLVNPVLLTANSPESIASASSFKPSCDTAVVDAISIWRCPVSSTSIRFVSLSVVTPCIIVVIFLYYILRLFIKICLNFAKIKRNMVINYLFFYRIIIF